MAIVTGQYFIDLLNNPKISVTNAEKIIDTGVALLNLLGGLQLAQMGGTAGAKTLGCDIRTQGAILLAARAVYYGFYERIQTLGANSFNLGVADLMSNPTVIDTIKSAAVQLVQKDWGRAII